MGREIHFRLEIHVCGETIRSYPAEEMIYLHPGSTSTITDILELDHTDTQLVYNWFLPANRHTYYTIEFVREDGTSHLVNMLDVTFVRMYPCTDYVIPGRISKA